MSDIARKDRSLVKLCMSFQIRSGWHTLRFTTRVARESSHGSAHVAEAGTVVLGSSCEERLKKVVEMFGWACSGGRVCVIMGPYGDE